jgi:hypothetical protein
MPWTRQQVKYLLSKGSPLTDKQQTKMKGELHSDPAMGHFHKGDSRNEEAAQNAHAYSEGRKRPTRS